MMWYDERCADLQEQRKQNHTQPLYSLKLSPTKQLINKKKNTKPLGCKYVDRAEPIYSINSVYLIPEKNLCNRFFFIYARLKISNE